MHRSGVNLTENEEFLVSGAAGGLTWRGVPIWKNPLDLHIYTEILYEVRPTLVIETGTYHGGSALFWVDHMRMWSGGAPMVVSIDIENSVRNLPKNPSVIYLSGDSIDEKIVKGVSAFAGFHERVLVNLDSSHEYGHVRRELEAYAPFVTQGSYLIVEDGIDDLRLGQPGALEACVAFLVDHPNFAADSSRERLRLTNCPNGFLRRR